MGSIACPSCQRLLQAPAGCVGVTVQCSECRRVFTAPEHDGAVPPSPSAADELAEAPERFCRPLCPARSGRIFAAGLGSVLASAAVSQSLCFVPLPLGLGVLAWAMGRTDLQAVRAGQLEPRGTRLIRAGVFLGFCGIAWACVRLALAAGNLV
jgi:hypothetical protein